MAKKGNFSVKIDVKELRAVIERAPKKADRAVKSAAFETERYIKTSFSAGRSLPGQPPGVDTGKLRAAINTKRIRELVYSVNTGDTEYAPYLEFGTRKKRGVSRRGLAVKVEFGGRKMAPRPFMGPGAKKGEEFLAEALRKAFEKP